MHQPTTSHRSGIIRKRTVRSSAGSKSTEDIDGGRFDGAYAFAKWYNNRIHGALDLECCETPNEAFVRKLRSGSILWMFLEWNEREVSL